MPNPVIALDSDQSPVDVLGSLPSVLASAPKGYIVSLVGRYGATSGGTPAEVAYLRGKGLALGAFYEAWPQAVLASTTPGAITPYAEAACQLAKDLGFTAGHRIFGGVEATSRLSAQVVLDWAAMLAAWGYLPGLYCQPASPSVQNALAAARSMSEDAAAITLWVASYITPTSGGGRLQTPEWAPPTCAGCAVSAWQYAPNVWSNGAHADLSLMDLDADGWWAPPAAPVTVDGFLDVPPGTETAAAVKYAVGAGLMRGESATAFAPDAGLTRGQFAIVLQRMGAKAAPVVTTATAPSSASRLPTTGEQSVTFVAVNVEHGAVSSASRAASAAPDFSHYRPSPGDVRPSRPRHGLLSPTLWIGASAASTSASRRAILAQMPIRDQQQTGMCVAEVAAALRLYWDLALAIAGAPGPYSVPYTYAKGHVLSGATTEGMQPVWAWEALRAFGVCPQALDRIAPYNEDVAQAIAALTPQDDDAAAVHRITAYGPVALTGDGTVGENAASLSAAIDHAPIAVSIPCYAGAQIFAPIADGLGGYIAQWPAGAVATEGHELLAYDYRTRTPYAGAQPQFEVLCRNSWGSSYAQGGDVWLGASYPLWEAWSVTCAPFSPAQLTLMQRIADLQEFLAQYPSIPAAQIAALQAAIASDQAQLAALPTA